MYHTQSERLFTVNEMRLAFAMGEESGSFIYEKAIGLSIEGQRCLLKQYKQMILMDKIKAIMESWVQL